MYFLYSLNYRDGGVAVQSDRQVCSPGIHMDLCVPIHSVLHHAHHLTPAPFVPLLTYSQVVARRGHVDLVPCVGNPGCVHRTVLRRSWMVCCIRCAGGRITGPSNVRNEFEILKSALVVCLHFEYVTSKLISYL